jgi:small subunit ribosomal protein S20
LANHASALKRARQNEVRRVRNKSYKTRVKKAVKEVRTAMAANSPDQTQDRFKEAVSVLQKTASKGVIHKNQASRKIARLARGINRLTAASQG